MKMASFQKMLACLTAQVAHKAITATTFYQQIELRLNVSRTLPVLVEPLVKPTVLLVCIFITPNVQIVQHQTTAVQAKLQENALLVSCATTLLVQSVEIQYHTPQEPNVQLVLSAQKVQLMHKLVHGRQCLSLLALFKRLTALTAFLVMYANGATEPTTNVLLEIIVLQVVIQAFTIRKFSNVQEVLTIRL